MTYYLVDPCYLLPTRDEKYFHAVKEAESGDGFANYGKRKLTVDSGTLGIIAP